MAQEKKQIVFLVGPTAIGKSEIAVRLAEKINAEIVSCDSMQIYKGMDVGTQKPPEEFRKSIKHHMVDILSPGEEFSVSDFRKRALKIIGKVHKKGKIPLFVGGTGLYVKALIDGLFPSPPKDEKLRRRLYRQKDIYEKLNKIDPDEAKLIHPNDTKKIIRALEIYYTTGKTKSQLKARTKPLTDNFKVIIFGLNRPRDVLYKRINERVEKIFRDGLMDEIKKLSKKKLGITAAQAIGYKEAFGFLKGENKGLGELKELIKKNTRRYAKKQLTWFRNDNRVEWLNIRGKKTPKRIASEVAAKIHSRNRFRP